MTLLALASLILTANCATSDGCPVFGRSFTPDRGFETRWTVSEKRQAVAHNRKVKRFCR